MILDEPIRNRQGTLLLKSGASLSAKNLIMLKSWGVSAVVVKSENGMQTRNDNTQQGLLEEIDRNLEAQFAEHIDDPVMIEIKRVAAKLIKGRAGMAPEAS